MCERTYTPLANLNGYSPEVRIRPIQLYLEGNSLRGIGRILKVNSQSVGNWVRAYPTDLPEASLPERPKVAELDEIYTFIGKKNNEIYILTIVDRDTCYISSWDFVTHHIIEVMQACLDRAPRALQYLAMLFQSTRLCIMWLHLNYGMTRKKSIRLKW
jgi:hypothetical protein